MARHNRKRKLSKKELKAKSKVDEAAEARSLEEATRVKKREVVPVALGETVTVAELAKRSGRGAAEIVGALLRNGVIATVNDSVDRTSIEIIADELEIAVQGEEEAVAELAEVNEAATAPRPPVVTVMGHVDHGKTTLLDAIRSTNVVAGESGGITQHIGAYQVTWKGSDGTERKITFVDTPGHEAFSAMRAHGANITDVVILVVAADDGVRPQTKEALSHARAANVPVIVAINKVDKTGANVDRVKGELAELGLASEDWGGKTPTVLVSAKQKQGIDELLDTVLLVADLADLSARPVGPAEGVVIEAHQQQGVGAVATVLIRHGQLRTGELIVCGASYGRARFMENDSGVRIHEAGPSTPVRIAGLPSVPGSGDRLSVVANERSAKARVAIVQPTRSKGSASREDGDEQPTLAIVLKADVDGSLEALAHSLESLPLDGVLIEIIHQAVGDVTESDMHLALAAAHPLVLAFNVNATVAAKNLAARHDVPIKAYDIIYRLLEDVAEDAKKLREPQEVTVELGKLKVLKIFKTTKSRQIVGGAVTEGLVKKRAELVIERAGEPIGTGHVESLQQGPTPVEEVRSGEECGLEVATTHSIEEGDVLTFTITQSQ